MKLVIGRENKDDNDRKTLNDLMQKYKYYFQNMKQIQKRKKDKQIAKMEMSELVKLKIDKNMSAVDVVNINQQKHILLQKQTTRYQSLDSKDRDTTT